MAGQKVFLISPRRYGKSSLISRALASAARGGLLTVEVTVSSYSSYLSFLEGYARAVLAAETRWSKAVSWLREAIGATRPEIRLETDPRGSAGVAVSFPAVRTARDVARLAPEVFALPARLADVRRRRVVVALDEFQAIGSFNGGSVEEALRAAVQHQRQVGYVFAGSEPSLMEAMLGPRRPFYKAGPVMRLQKIPAEPFAAFIEQRFARTGIRPEDGFGMAVLDLAGHLPYDVQRLAHEAWDDARAVGAKRVGLEHLHITLRRLLAEQAVFFEATWQRLTLPQRAYPPRARARRRRRPPRRRRARAVSPRRRLVRAGGAGGASAPGCRDAGGRSLGGSGLADARVDRAEDVLMAGGWLARLGLRTREQRAWAMYDWANSAFQCTIITAVFPIYFAKVAAEGHARRAGDRALRDGDDRRADGDRDHGASARRLRGLRRREEAPARRLHGLGVVATAAMYLIGPGDWKLAAWLFIASNICISASFVFYDSLLPHIADGEEMDRVSSAGYALGYLGGGLLLAINLAWILKPQMFGLRDSGVASRVSFVSVAVWWLLFSIPLFRRVPEPSVRPSDLPPGIGPVRASFQQLGATIRELRRFREAFLMLVAFLIYNDGIGTIIRMAGPYGAGDRVAGERPHQRVRDGAVRRHPVRLRVRRTGRSHRRQASDLLALIVYVGISVVGYFMRSVWQFWLLSFMVAMVQGGSQALSRSLFASMIPKEKSSEFFGFFGVFEKFAGIFGPALFAITVQLTGSSRHAILSVIGFFVVGAVLLARVDVAKGQAAATGMDRAACATRRPAELSSTGGSRAGPRCARAGPASPARPCFARRLAADPLARLGPRERVLQRVPVERQHGAPEFLRLRVIAGLLRGPRLEHHDERVLLIGAGQRRERGVRVACVELHVTGEIRERGRLVLQRR